MAKENGKADPKLVAAVKEWAPLRAQRDKLQTELETLAEKESILAQRIHAIQGNKPFRMNGSDYRAVQRNPKDAEGNAKGEPSYSIRALAQYDATDITV